jgi:hypothetical protein
VCAAALASLVECSLKGFASHGVAGNYLGHGDAD